MSESKRLMTQAEYARHRGVSRQRINALAKSGVLVMRGRLVDVEASDAVLDDRPERHTEQVSAAQAELHAKADGLSYAQARTADMILRAKLRKLEYDQRAGRLVDAELVRQRWSAILRVIVERVLSWPNRLAPELAAASEERQARDILMREARLLIEELRRDVERAR